ncbi:MAG: 6-phosphofructokinase [Lachnospiraceae bacterium]|nr:6-phosphofructokinase [Lachnospiraceae bacterium]
MKNVIVGQSGGPSSVINSSLAGVYCRAKELGADKVYGMRNGIQGFLDERLVDLGEILKSEKEVELLKKTPAAFLGSCRFKLPDAEKKPEVFEKIFALLNKYEIKVFIYIGGNDSMDTIRKLADYGLATGSEIRFVGAPKTIDNDLAETDHTPGFGSAAKFIAAMTKEAIRDEVVYSTNRTIYVMEIMGRNAGWLTAAAALARGNDNPGPDLIYLPEVPFDMDAFLGKIAGLLAKKNNIMVAVSEGIHDDKGTFICEYAAADKAVDAFGHKQMGGTATYLCSVLEEKFGCKTRAIELSTLQRCAAHLASQTDVDEAFASGAKAVEAGLNGRTALMATLNRASQDPYRCEIGLADVHYISNVERLVPREWISEDGDDVTKDFVRYALPLIQGESWPVIENGLPKHLVLE